MAKQLIYTSAPRGLRPNASGYCVVLSTRGLSLEDEDALQGLTEFPLDQLSEGGAGQIPNFSHVRIRRSRRSASVLFRVAHSGLDYSNRHCKLAHFYLLDASDAERGGPTVILQNPGLFADKWEGEPRLLVEESSLPVSPLSPMACATWGQYSGDAGWGGVLSELAVDPRARPMLVIYEPGMDVAALVTESASILDPADRWLATFATHFSGLPEAVECCWRFTPANSPFLGDLKREHGSTVINLTQRLDAPMECPAVSAARNGSTMRVSASGSGFAPAAKSTATPAAADRSSAHPTVHETPIPEVGASMFDTADDRLTGSVYGAPAVAISPGVEYIDEPSPDDSVGSVDSTDSADSSDRLPPAPPSAAPPEPVPRKSDGRHAGLIVVISAAAGIGLLIILGTVALIVLLNRTNRDEPIGQGDADDPVVDRDRSDGGGDPDRVEPDRDDPDRGRNGNRTTDPFDRGRGRGSAGRGSTPADDPDGTDPDDREARPATTPGEQPPRIWAWGNRDEDDPPLETDRERSGVGDGLPIQPPEIRRGPTEPLTRRVLTEGLAESLAPNDYLWSFPHVRGAAYSDPQFLHGLAIDLDQDEQGIARAPSESIWDETELRWDLVVPRGNPSQLRLDSENGQWRFSLQGESIAMIDRIGRQLVFSWDGESDRESRLRFLRNAAQLSLVLTARARWIDGQPLLMERRFQLFRPYRYQAETIDMVKAFQRYAFVTLHDFEFTGGLLPIDQVVTDLEETNGNILVGQANHLISTFEDSYPADEEPPFPAVVVDKIRHLGDQSFEFTLHCYYVNLLQQQRQFERMTLVQIDAILERVTAGGQSPFPPEIRERGMRLLASIREQRLECLIEPLLMLNLEGSEGEAVDIVLAAPESYFGE